MFSKYYPSIFVAGMIVSAVVFGADAGLKPDASSSNNLNQLRDAIETANVSINFWGKLVDQDETPVPDAEVDICIRGYIPSLPFFMGTRNVLVKTDAQGIFKVEGETGHLLNIRSVRKQGYYVADDAEYSKNYWYGGVANPFSPVEAKPVVYHIHREKDGVFLLHKSSIHMLIEEDGIASLQFDLSKMEVKPGTPLPDYFKEEADCSFEALGSSIEGDYMFTLESRATGLKIAGSETLLFEAPKGGYGTQVAIPYSAVGEGRPCYLYIRGNTPPIYSMVKVEMFSKVNGVCDVVFDWYINPYGDDSFEQCTDIPLELSGRLNSQALEALSQGRLPEKPDLPKLIEEYRNKEK